MPAKKRASSSVFKSALQKAEESNAKAAAKEAAKKAAKEKAFYASRAAELRDAGFHVALRGNKKATPQQKSAVTRLYRRISTYVKPEHNYVFKKLPRNIAKKSAVSEQQKTPGGIFVQINRAVSKTSARISVDKETGAVGIRYKTLHRREEILKLNSRELAKDPLKEIRRVLGEKKPSFVKLQVNGHDTLGDSYQADDPKAARVFYDYWEKIYAELTDEEARDEAREAQSLDDKRRGRYEGRTMSAREVSNKFTLKLIYQ